MNLAHPTADAIARWLRDCSAAAGAGAPVDDRLCRVLKFITTHLGERLDLDSMAAETGIARRTLTWLVRHELNCSTGQLITWLRLRRAMQALAETDTSITDVALTAGYSSANKMANHFARYLGVSPRDYRAKLAGGGSQWPAAPSPAPTSPGSLATGKSASSQPSHL